MSCALDDGYKMRGDALFMFSMPSEKLAHLQSIIFGGEESYLEINC